MGMVRMTMPSTFVVSVERLRPPFSERKLPHVICWYKCMCVCFFGCACPPVLSYHDSCIHSSLVLTRSDSMWMFVHVIIHALTYALICRRLRADSCFSMLMIMLLAKFLTISTHGRTSQHDCLPHAQHIVTGLTCLTMLNILHMLNMFHMLVSVNFGTRRRWHTEIHCDKHKLTNVTNAGASTSTHTEVFAMTGTNIHSMCANGTWVK